MKNIKPGQAGIAGIIVLSLFFASSCQQFFTSSLAKPLARTKYNIPANLPVEEAISLLAESGGDPKVAAALVTPLLNAAKAASPGTKAYNTAANGLLDAAVGSSGVNAAIANALSAMASETPDYSAIFDSFNAVSLNADSKEALILIATNPPENMSPDTAISAVAALVAVACAEEGVGVSGIMDNPEQDLIDRLKDKPEIEAAVKLIDKVKEIAPDSIFASLFDDLPSDF